MSARKEKVPSWSRGKLPRSGGGAEKVVKLGGRPKLIVVVLV